MSAWEGHRKDVEETDGGNDRSKEKKRLMENEKKQCQQTGDSKIVPERILE